MDKAAIQTLAICEPMKVITQYPGIKYDYGSMRPHHLSKTTMHSE